MPPPETPSGEGLRAEHARLNARHLSEQSEHPDAIRLRVHRALSWLDRASRTEDSDGRFIFLWISLNAAYGRHFHDNATSHDRRVLTKFVNQLVRLDGNQSLYGLIWDEFSGSIRMLLDNQYAYAPFWNYQGDSSVQWERSFERDRDSVRRALRSGDTTKMLVIVVSRLYTVRNQLIHGAATWNSRLNRPQVRDSAKLLGKLVPQVIRLLLDNPREDWGENMYPALPQDGGEAFPGT